LGIIESSFSVQFYPTAWRFHGKGTCFDRRGALQSLRLLCGVLPLPRAGAFPRFNSKGYHPPHVVHPEKCSGCDLCGMYCPDFAICAAKVDPPKKAVSSKDVSAQEGEK